MTTALPPRSERGMRNDPPKQAQTVKQYAKTVDAQCAKQAQRTPGPWHLGLKQAEQIIYDSHGWAICNCTVYHGHESAEPKANAAFIVRACNSHDDLLAAIKAVIALDSCTIAMQRSDPRAVALRAAIAKAEA